MNDCYMPNSTRQSRKTWIRHFGPIPEGLQVLHKCDNFLCVNLDHLYLGTAKQNTKDMFERDRFGDQNRPKITDDHIERWLNGESSEKLAKEIGCHKNAISWAYRNRWLGSTSMEQ